MDFSFLNIWAVLTAAVSCFVLGALWYGPLFGKAWLKESGLTEEQAAQNQLPTFAAAFVLTLVSALNLAMLLGPKADLTFGLFAGAMTGVFFVAASLGIIYLFEKKSFGLFLINGGYMAVGFTVMGGILGFWR